MIPLAIFSLIVVFAIALRTRYAKGGAKALMMIGLILILAGGGWGAIVLSSASSRDTAAHWQVIRVLWATAGPGLLLVLLGWALDTRRSRTN